jgi:hypothetical protein
VNDDRNDPFLKSLNRWKSRVEHVAFFIFLVVHLLLIHLIGLSVLVQHVYGLLDELRTRPSAEEPLGKSTR